MPTRIPAGSPSLGRWLARKREDVGLDQATLAARLGWSVETLRRVERGRRGFRNDGEMMLVARELAVPFADVAAAASGAPTSTPLSVLVAQRQRGGVLALIGSIGAAWLQGEQALRKDMRAAARVLWDEMKDLRWDMIFVHPWPKETRPYPNESLEAREVWRAHRTTIARGAKSDEFTQIRLAFEDVPRCVFPKDQSLELLDEAEESLRKWAEVVKQPE